MTAAEQGADDHLAWEERRRRPAAAASVAAGLLLLAAPLLLVATVYRDFPSVGLVQALAPALHGAARTGPDPRTGGILYLHRHATALVANGVITLLGYAALAVILAFLLRATQARRPELPRLLLAGAIGGPVLSGVVWLATVVVLASRASHFASSTDHSHAAVEHAVAGSNSIVIGSIGTLGTLLTAATVALIALNAMRVGLLTRFMGVMGVIAALLFVLRIIPIPIVQAFWLLALAPLVLLRWPQGQPPAWITGRAEPWPTAQELAAQREAARNRTEAQAIKDAPAASELDPAEPVRPAQPRPDRRKKRRR